MIQEPIISGIQQVGIGIPNVHEAFNWYRKHFGVDIPVFEEAAEANLMLPYTGGTPQQRHAILAINLQGGGGMEIWQYVSRKPKPPLSYLKLGDLGIYITKVKCINIEPCYEFAKKNKMHILGELNTEPTRNKHFFVKDPYGNIFQYIESDAVFTKTKAVCGGMYGAIIGVSDLEKSKNFYSTILGYDEIRFEGEQAFPDFVALPSGTASFKRCILTHSQPRVGPFSRLLSKSEIELVELQGSEAQHIYANRYWGDLGFIHLCSPFSVDSAKAHQNGFDMGEAAGHFSYIEDPDGTLIEFVETHKIPILKKLGWYLHLKKRNPLKPLPDFMLKAMAFNRVK